MKRVVVGAIAALGGYLFLVRLGETAKLDEFWLPYVAELTGALIAGGALARIGTRRRFEAFATGVVSVVIVGTVAFVSPRTFGWVAARSDHPWPTAFALAIGCGIFAHLGAWLAYGRGGLASIVVFSTGVSTALLLFGARIVAVLVTTVVAIKDPTAVGIVILLAMGFLAGFAVQSVVPLLNAGACASGTAILLGWQVIEAEMHGHRSDGFLWVVLTVAAAFGGAFAAQAVRPKSREPDTAAFD
jgi:hypothetical protein